MDLPRTIALSTVGEARSGQELGDVLQQHMPGNDDVDYVHRALDGGEAAGRDVGGQCLGDARVAGRDRDDLRIGARESGEDEGSLLSR